jgi:hypothetical protein
VITGQSLAPEGDRGSNFGWGHIRAC